MIRFVRRGIEQIGMPRQMDARNVQEALMETKKVYSTALLAILGTDPKMLEVSNVQPAPKIGLCQELDNTDAWLVITTAKVRQDLPSVLVTMVQIVRNGSTPKVTNLSLIAKRTIGTTPKTIEDSE